MSSPLQNNIVNLQNILNSVNNLPDANFNINLPELTNPADASKTLSGYEFINENGSKMIGTMPTATQATPSISVSSAGLITATVTQTAGYVSAGTKNGTKQLTTQAAKTITPNTSAQTAVASGVYTTGTVTVAGDTNLKAENIKSGVSIFGVAGSLSGATVQRTTGSFTPSNSGSATVNCGFKPDLVVINNGTDSSKRLTLTFPFAAINASETFHALMDYNVDDYYAEYAAVCTADCKLTSNGFAISNFIMYSYSGDSLTYPHSVDYIAIKYT